MHGWELKMNWLHTTQPWPGMERCLKHISNVQTVTERGVSSKLQSSSPQFKNWINLPSVQSLPTHSQPSWVSWSWDSRCNYEHVHHRRLAEDLLFTRVFRCLGSVYSHSWRINLNVNWALNNLPYCGGPIYPWPASNIERTDIADSHSVLDRWSATSTTK